MPSTEARKRKPKVLSLIGADLIGVTSGHKEEGNIVTDKALLMATGLCPRVVTPSAGRNNSEDEIICS